MSVLSDKDHRQPSTNAGRSFAGPMGDRHTPRCHARMHGPRHLDCSCGLTGLVIRIETEAIDIGRRTQP